MKKQIIYSIYKRVEGIFMPMWCAFNDKIAIASYDASLEKVVKESKIYDKDDFELWKLGEFDFIKGNIILTEKELVKKG